MVFSMHSELAWISLPVYCTACFNLSLCYLELIYWDQTRLSGYLPSLPFSLHLYWNICKGLIETTLCSTIGTDCLGCFRNNIWKISPKAVVFSLKPGRMELLLWSREDCMKRHSKSASPSWNSFLFLLDKYIFQPAYVWKLQHYCTV